MSSTRQGERRRIWIVLMFAVLFTVLAFVGGGCGADTYTVCSSGCNYTSIQNAIDAAQPGDTIIVRDGIYTENIDVTVNNLTIRSENGSANCFVSALDHNDHVFYVTADWVNISGFTVTNATENYKAGIHLADSVGHLTIFSNNVTKNYYGIYLSSFSSSNTLTENTVIMNNYDGIRLSMSSHNILTGNNIVSNAGIGISCINNNNNTLIGNNVTNHTSEGILLSSSNNNNLTSNTFISNNNAGIFLVYSNGNDLTGNMITNSPAGIEIRFSNGNNITCNTVTNNSMGIEFRFPSNNNTLFGNIATNNTNSGIYINASSNNTLTGNTASNNTYGIWLYASSNNNLTGNIASYNDFAGIDLNSSSNNTLTGNTANANNAFGIVLDSANNNNLSSNIVSTSEGGISLWYSSNNNTLTGNTVSNSGWSIELYSSSNNTLTSNIASNNYYGMYLSSSSTNTLMGNNASNNYYGVYLYASSNNSLTGNTAASNTNEGFFLYDSSNNTLKSNTALNNSYNGIYLYISSNNNTFSGNNVSNNGFGIWLDYSSNNLIYNNYFDNIQNAYDNGNNTWNITKTPGTNIIGGSYLGGNYWSDYAGEDTNGDGLGDTPLPYNASDNIVNGGDWLPLVTNGGVPDTTPPAAITNLATSNPTSSSTQLSWTAPGDDGTSGTASAYDIRYRTGGAITNANWASATQVTEEPDPQAAGSSEAFTVTGLSASTTYYFAIKTADEVPNWSPISNSPHETTLPPEEVPIVYIEDGQIEGIGATTVIDITLDTAPDGLSGYNMTISLSNTSIAEILAVEFPAWAALNAKATLPADTVWIKAVDMMKQVDPGATNVTLAKLIIRGDAAGECTINAAVTQMDPDGAGEPINPLVNPGQLTVLSVVPLPGYDNPPTDPDGDGLYEDLNGNGGLDFNDVVQLFKYLEWIEANEPNSLFDFNGNGRLDFADIVQLFKEV